MIHILEVCKLLEHRVPTYCTNYVPKYKIWSKSANKFKESNINAVTIKPTDRSTCILVKYEEKDKKFMKNFMHPKARTLSMYIVAPNIHILMGNGNMLNMQLTMIFNKTNDFRGWRCEIGSKRLLVWHDGTVYGAQCGTAKNNPLENIKRQKSKITSIV